MTSPVNRPCEFLWWFCPFSSFVSLLILHSHHYHHLQISFHPPLFTTTTNHHIRQLSHSHHHQRSPSLFSLTFHQHHLYTLPLPQSQHTTSSITIHNPPFLPTVSVSHPPSFLTVISPVLSTHPPPPSTTLPLYQELRGVSECDSLQI
ncbi:hypothetical protein Pcinc_015797 [Petrolisthes cinctipes]|uniref:Uncharacterized protein n=1 Tax=Petrolisthes cinctipes TaxID=88211 RepID=A0AAE1KQ40_PETCI|nr:hypothetical protein Pcinc_015797 [Petrolisthes cinctipes]